MDFNATTIVFEINFYQSKRQSESNGLIYATPLPVIVCLGVNDVLFGRNVSDTSPVFPDNTCTLFLTVSGIKICWMYNLCYA